jgi:hypothetical protein
MRERNRPRIASQPSVGAQAAGDIGLGLEEAETLMSAIQHHFVSAQATEIVETRRRGISPLKDG